MQTNFSKTEVLGKDKLADFYKLLETASISDNEKKSIKFAIEFMDGKHSLKLATRSFIFHGDPGVGKTYLVEELLKVFNIPVIFSGCAEVKLPNLIKCDELDGIIKEIQKHDRFIVFLDDLSYIFKFSDYINEISADIKQQFMKITDLIKRNETRALLLVTTNNLNFLDESILDRIEAKINVNIPSEENKLKFLLKNYSEIIKPRDSRYLARQSIGYNYRDLPEVVKISYRNGNGIIRADNIRDAMKEYVPTSLLNLKVTNSINLNFSSVIGREKIKNILRNVINAYKNQRLTKSLGLTRHNLLIFEGPPGTGKTFMVQALAGELKFPIINYTANNLARCGIANTVESIGTISKRFKNCIIFIDEADKLLGRHTLDEDSPVDGHLNEIFDGLDSVTNSIVIVGLNNINRFGSGLKDRFAAVTFELPNYQERLEFCRIKLEKVKNFVRHNISLEEIARITLEMSFRDIEKMWNEAFYKYLEKKSMLTTAIFHDIVTSMNNYENYSRIYG